MEKTAETDLENTKFNSLSQTTNNDALKNLFDNLGQIDAEYSQNDKEGQ